MRVVEGLGSPLRAAGGAVRREGGRAGGPRGEFRPNPRGRGEGALVACRNTGVVGLRG